MARYSAGWYSEQESDATSDYVWDADRAFGSLYAGASVSPRILEVGVNVWGRRAVAVALVRFTENDPSPFTFTAAKHDDRSPAASATPQKIHYTDNNTTDVIKRAQLDGFPSEGAQIIWTFGGRGLIIPAGTSNGIGLTAMDNGTTSQVAPKMTFYFVWEE